MKSALTAVLFLLAGTGAPAFSHSALLARTHPHTGVAGYFSLETLAIFVIGLSYGGFVTCLRRRKEMSK